MAKGVNYYDGSSWKEVATVEDGNGNERPVKRWDGSTWVKIYPSTTVIDDFESGNINAYSGDTSNFSTTSAQVFEGSFSLDVSFQGDIHTNNAPGGTQPSFGTDFEWYVYTPSSIQTFPFLIFESDLQDAQGTPTGYFITVQSGVPFNSDRFRIFGSVPGDLNGAGGDTVDISGQLDKWLRVKVTFSGNTVTADLIDTTNDSLLGSVSMDQFNTLGTFYALGNSKSNTAYIDQIGTI